MNRLIATVAVENTFFNTDSDYDYYVPQKLENCIKCGTKVKVPFGRGNVLRSGIVLSVFSGINSELKEIHSADDKIIPLDEEMIQLALWLKERCFAPLMTVCVKCFRAVLIKFPIKAAG